MNSGDETPTTRKEVASLGQMTLRDFFAASVLTQPDIRFASLFSNSWAAEMAYQRADAMLEARRK